jgi:TRAP-type uncharacterized transport system fused permease subunit
LEREIKRVASDENKIEEDFMFKKCLSLVFIGLLTFAVNLKFISAQSDTNNSVETNKAEKIKTNVNRRGVGEKSKVVVKMKNGAKLKGYISQTLEDSFDLTNAETKQPTTILYREVAQVKRQGWSKGAKTAIGVGIAAAVVGLILTLPGKNPFPGGFCPLGCR